MWMWVIHDQHDPAGRTDSCVGTDLNMQPTRRNKVDMYSNSPYLLPFLVVRKVRCHFSYAQMQFDDRPLTAIELLLVGASSVTDDLSHLRFPPLCAQILTSWHMDMPDCATYLRYSMILSVRISAFSAAKGGGSPR
jgi:hypothetical protein